MLGIDLSFVAMLVGDMSLQVESGSELLITSVTLMLFSRQCINLQRLFQLDMLNWLLGALD